MKFLSFIASTMLIVLVSQHSVMGLPLNTTAVNESCSEGFEMINGQCMPIEPMTSTLSNPPETVTIEEPKPVTELNKLERFGACPEGMKHGEHGICKPIETYESTTELDESVGGVDNPKGCPKGTEPDEQGACQETNPSKSTKITTDPKLFLNKDGSCPEDYKMVENRCLYVKPKMNSTLYSSDSTADVISNGIRPKSGNDEGSKVELVPVLPDNSCPEGTEYSEYGLCQKRSRPSNSNFGKRTDDSCPDDFELVNGKCIDKKSEIATRNIILSSTTLAADIFIHDEVSQSTTVVEQSAYES